MSGGGDLHNRARARYWPLLAAPQRASHKETSPESAGFFGRVKDFFEGKGPRSTVTLSGGQDRTA